VSAVAVLPGVRRRLPQGWGTHRPDVVWTIDASHVSSFSVVPGDREGTVMARSGAATGRCRQLAAWRHRYTGEPLTRLIPHAEKIAARLQASQVELLNDAFRFVPTDQVSTSGWSARHTELVQLRALLMPDARTRDQQLLESWLLYAAAKSAKSLQLRPPADHYRPAHAISVIHPPEPGADDCVSLGLTGPYALGPLLAELLPCIGPDDEIELGGLAGLRVHHQQHALTLSLLGTDASARIVNVTHDTWSAARVFLDHFYSPNVQWMWKHSADGITPDEEADLERYGRYQLDHVDIGSALLRRLPLVRETHYVDIWQSDASWKLEWRGRLSPAEAASDLQHPLFGLSGWFDATRYGGSEDSIVLEPVHRGDEANSGEQHMPRVVLRRDATRPSKESTSLFGRGRSEPLACWVQWERTPAGRKGNPILPPRVADRADYTGESWAAAHRGLDSCSQDGRPNAGEWHGMDTCSDAQRQLRALLAVYVFNSGKMGASPPADRLIGAITHYTMTLSPRHDNLVIFTDAPDNLTNYFVRRGPSGGFPGMRLESRPNGGTFNLRYLTNGATLTITSHREGDGPAGWRSADEDEWDTRRWCGTDVSLTAAEFDEIHSIPSMSPDIEKLVSAVLVRISTSEPHGKWAIGTWYYDPLERDPAYRPSTDERRLSGSDDSWELRWHGYPYVEDVVASLVDPAIGVSGLSVERKRDDHHAARLGKGCLKIGR
jgi:hypothetical protein